MERMVGAPTSATILPIRPDGSRPVLHARGASARWKISPEAQKAACGSKVLHLGGVGSLLAMDGEPTVALLRDAKAAGCITTVDLIQARAETLKLVEPLMPYTDFFMPSIDETHALVGTDDPAACAQYFIGKGAGACAISLGEHGSFVMTRDGRQFTVPAFNVKVRDTSGCGDSYTGGFIAGLVRDDIRQATSGFPALMRLPILGSLFRSKDFQRNETELVIIATPYLVRPVERSKIARPDDNFNPEGDIGTFFLNRVNKVYGRRENAQLPGRYNGTIGFIYNKKASLTPATSPARLAGTASVVLLAALLGACGTARPDQQTTSSIPDDYRTRHPITVAEVEHTLDVPIGADEHGLTHATRDLIKGFAQDYEVTSKSTIRIAIPMNAANSAAASSLRNMVRRALTDNGVPANRVVLTSYQSP
eukprot:gene40691-55023_t